MFPKIEISPLVAIMVYDIKGLQVFQLKSDITETEEEFLYKHFFHPAELLDWVRKYSEITLFRGDYRATFVKILNGTMLFISRVTNVSAEFRPIIRHYIELVGARILQELAGDSDIQLLPVLCSSTIIKDEVVQEINRLFEHFQIKTSIEVTKAISQSSVQFRDDQAKTFERLQPFETVPQIPYQEMTEELLNEALKKAVTSLLLSAIKDCVSNAAAAYIFPRPEGTIGQLYAGDLSENKIVYVLETLTKFIRVVYEMLKSKDEIKVLNAEVVQIIVEGMYNGRFLVGMTTDTNDIMKVAYRLKLIKHVISNIGL